MAAPTNILVAVDGSDHASRAVEYAAGLAARCDARLTLLHVLEGRPKPLATTRDLEEYERLEHLHVTSADLLQAAGNRILGREAVTSSRAGVPATSVTRTGDPATTIVDEADQMHADLVVMGSRGLSDAKGLLLGSVSHKVMSASDRPVLVVR